MSSNLNNAAEISADDFFNTNRYEGPIYQTKNLQDRTLAQIAPTDSARTKVREQIEAEIRTFQRNVWMGDSVKPEMSPTPPRWKAPTASTARSLRAMWRPKSSKSRRPPNLKRHHPVSSATLSVRRQRH